MRLRVTIDESWTALCVMEALIAFCAGLAIAWASSWTAGFAVGIWLAVTALLMTLWVSAGKEPRRADDDHGPEH